MIRLLFLLHRYLGIGVGLIMLIWTLSGIIMMYQEYPELDAREQLALLSPLEVANCCELPDSRLLRDENFSDARIEMLGEVPVLRASSLERGLLTYDLRQGTRIDSITESKAQALANAFTSSHLPGAIATLSAQIFNDQWTVYGAYNPLRPLYKFTVDDAAGTELYISSKTGEIVQLTTSSQRFWGYAGAVIHWLYPTILRQHTALWAQVVIWLTILGIFLTLTGLYIGIRQFRARANGRLSPYRGMALYHHYAGLIFGVLTLTWVASGLLSMNPWGALEGEGGRAEAQRLTERPLTWRDIESVLQRLPQTNPGLAVRARLSVLRGDAQLIAYAGTGAGERLNPMTFRPQPLTNQDLSQLATRLRPEAEIRSETLISESDAYYYDHHEALEFPVYRVSLADDQNRIYYLSPLSGMLLRKVDSELRLYRWLFYGLHRGDFTAWLRSRPVWDSFMLLFLLGVALVCGTGSYMAIRRLRRDMMLKRHRAQIAPSFGEGLEEF